MSKKYDGLARNNAHFANPKGPDLFERTQEYFDWIRTRHKNGLWPYARFLASSPNSEADISYLGGRLQKGINLAVQDYLSLSTHPRIKEAATRAIVDFGVHSAGSPMLLGNNMLSISLENKIKDFLQCDHVLLFPTGWAAGYGVVKGLVCEYDHIVMDSLSHACLQAGAEAATNNVTKVKHLSSESVEQSLRKIRAVDPKNGILVISEGLFSMDSDSPNIDELQNMCHAYGAKLLIDVAHDLGAVGPGGRGQLGIQELNGKIDLVMGSFSKTFASNGGFLATNSPKVKSYLRWFANSHTFSNALSPIQCAIVREAFEIVESAEGEMLRRRLMEASISFRSKLIEKGLRILGDPSAIVPVLIGRDSVARIASRNLQDASVFANLVEFPAVALGSSRFRCQLMATHTTDQLAAAASAIARAIEDAAGMANNEYLKNESEKGDPEIYEFDPKFA